MDSIGGRLDEVRDTGRYLVGVLEFAFDAAGDGGPAVGQGRNEADDHVGLVDEQKIAGVDLAADQVERVFLVVLGVHLGTKNIVDFLLAFIREENQVDTVESIVELIGNDSFSE